MLEVMKAEYAGDYSIRLVFNNGKTGVANLERTILEDKREIVARLKEKSLFKDFKVEHSTVVWRDGLDLASEYLFYLTFQDDPGLRKQFEEWGYM